MGLRQIHQEKFNIPDNEVMMEVGQSLDIQRTTENARELVQLIMNLDI